MKEVNLTKQKPENGRIVKAVLWQLAPGHFPNEEERRVLKGKRPDLVILPEYHAVPPDALSHKQTFINFDRNLDRLRALAVDLNCVVVGGTVVEKEGQDFFNTCFVFDRRRTAGFYRKVNVTEKEQAAGITPGSSYRVLAAGGLRIGILVCADVLQPKAFTAMRDQKADIVAVPTVSPKILEDTLAAKDSRDHGIFVSGAARAKSYVLKVCAVRSFLGSPLQGRSLAAAPWGLLTRIPPEGEADERAMVVDLSMEKLDTWRRGPAVKRAQPA